MNKVSVILLSLLLVVVGCATRVETGQRFGRINHGYSESELALALTQDDRSGDLLLTLTNTSSHPITNFFPEARFEGYLLVLQEGAAPLKAFPSEYWHLFMHAFWVNPEVVIPREGALHYRVPLETLVSPLSSRQLGGNQPVFVYAFMDGTEVVSNVILLRHPEKIQWSYSELSGATRSGNPP